MIRRFFAAIVLAAVVMLSPPPLVDARTHAPAGQSQLAQFQTEAAAQAHCPRDVVVLVEHSDWDLSRERDALVRPHEERRVRLPQRGQRCR